MTDFSQKTPSDRPTISWSFWSAPWITATAQISFLVRERACACVSYQLLDYWHAFRKQALGAPAASLCDVRPPRVVHTRVRRNLAHVGGFSGISLLTELARAGTCVSAFLKELRVPLPDPAKCSMGSLFKFIYTHLNDKVPYPDIEQETRIRTPS